MSNKELDAFKKIKSHLAYIDRIEDRENGKLKYDSEEEIPIVEKALEEKQIVEKAIKSGIYNGVPEHIRAVGLVYMLGRFYLVCFDENGRTTGSYPLNEYKTTWWLKADRSE